MKAENISSDQELLQFHCNLFDSSDINYWVDSGTMLGLVRDDKLLPQQADGDLDFGIFADDLETTIKSVKKITEFSNDIQIKKYSGEIFEVKIVPKEKNVRHIGINVFREGKGYDNSCYYWCPVPYFEGPFSKHSKLSPISEGMKDLLRYFNKNKSGVVEVDRGVVNYIIDIGTWWIPSKYFSEFELEKVYNSRIPSPASDYLEFRYGDWQNPTSSWDYWYDDGGVIQKPPKELLQ